MNRTLRKNSQPRRGLRREESAAYIGVGATKFDELVTRELMPRPIKIDGVTLWDLNELDRAFDELSGAGTNENPFDELTA